jgi:L-amino acid N-acyltransferase YncA
MTTSTSPVSVATLKIGHWPDSERIYAAGIATGHATFESKPPTWEEFDQTRLPDQRRQVS